MKKSIVTLNSIVTETINCALGFNRSKKTENRILKHVQETCEAATRVGVEVDVLEQIQWEQILEDAGY